MNHLDRLGFGRLAGVSRFSDEDFNVLLRVVSSNEPNPETVSNWIVEASLEDVMKVIENLMKTGEMIEKIQLVRKDPMVE